MDSDLLQLITFLRIIIGYLGEKEQHGWWASSFFSKGSEAFLAPVFPRTQLLAQYTGVSKAAALLHDERIGVGDVFHLFRLPEELALGIHQVVQSSAFAEAVKEQIASPQTALDYLNTGAVSTNGSGVGPIRIGQRASLYDVGSWATVRAAYARAFDNGSQVFPYFTGSDR